PPLLGFWAKVAVLRAALVGDLLWLAIVGVVFAVIGAFYYLRVIKVMYFEQPAGEPIVVRGGALQAVFAVNALALLGLGLAWNPIMAWCQAAFARDPGGGSGPVARPGLSKPPSVAIISRLCCGVEQSGSSSGS